MLSRRNGSRSAMPRFACSALYVAATVSFVIIASDSQTPLPACQIHTHTRSLSLSLSLSCSLSLSLTHTHTYSLPSLPHTHTQRRIYIYIYVKLFQKKFRRTGKFRTIAEKSHFWRHTFSRWAVFERREKSCDVLIIYLDSLLVRLFFKDASYKENLIL